MGAKVSAHMGACGERRKNGWTACKHINKQKRTCFCVRIDICIYTESISIPNLYLSCTCICIYIFRLGPCL